MSAAAFDAQWVDEPGRLMVHSVELVFDPDTEEAVRRIWDGLRRGRDPQPGAASRPHATLTVAERIDAGWTRSERR
jgi:hypothetical protein